MARTSRKKKYKEENVLLPQAVTYMTALYVRLSNEEIEEDFTNKIKNQRELLIQFISDKPQYRLVDIYIDNGCTGTNFDRPQWQRLMEDVRAGKVNCIIVKDLSRLGRNYTEAGEYIEKVFPFLGVRFIAISDGYDSAVKKNNSDIMIPLKNIINASYAKDLSVKVSSARHIQRSKGEFTGSRVPFGYRRDEKKKGKFVVDEKAAEIVRNIFTLMAEGYSYSETARDLNNRKIPSPQGKMWGYQTIKSITSNEVYLGNMVQGKKCTLGSNPAEVKNTHEAIIEKKLFMQVCQQREKISIKRMPKENKEIYLFQGLLVAENSKKVLTRTQYTKQRGRVTVKAYRSPRTYNEQGIPYKIIMIREETLITTIKKIIFYYLEVLNIMESFLKLENIQRVHQNRLKQMEIILQEKQNSLFRKKVLFSDCYSDMTEGIISFEEYKSYSEKYQKDIAQIEKEIKEEETKAKEYQKIIALKNPYIAVLKKFGQTERVTRELLKLLIKKIIVLSSKEIKIYFTFKDEFKSLQKIIKEDANEIKKDNSFLS